MSKPDEGRKTAGPVFQITWGNFGQADGSCSEDYIWSYTRCLGNPTDWGAWWATVRGAEVGHDLGITLPTPHISDLHLRMRRLLMYRVKWEWRQATRWHDSWHSVLKFPGEHKDTCEHFLEHSIIHSTFFEFYYVLGTAGYTNRRQSLMSIIKSAEGDK